MDLAVGLAMGQQVARQMSDPGPAQSPHAAPVPPPLPTAEWYVGRNGVREGPFDLSTVQQQIAAGTLTAGTLVWKAGMAGWIAAGEQAELRSLFAAVPPPLPGA